MHSTTIVLIIKETYPGTVLQLIHNYKVTNVSEFALELDLFIILNIYHIYQIETRLLTLIIP